MAYYGVKKGRQPGVYDNWEDCKNQVDGYSGAIYKKFNTLSEARDFVGLDPNEEICPQKIPKDTLVAYVDGSFDSSDKSYSFGAVFLETDGQTLYSKRFKKDSYSESRNVAGEIKAAEFAFAYAIEKGYEKLILHYDYEGIEKWAKGQWKANLELTQEYSSYYDEISQILDVEFVKVRAHSGDRYNEMADTLAKNADFELRKEK